ncbi:MAG: hypothetical protein ACK462_03460, partial [Planctomyces sp.]
MASIRHVLARSARAALSAAAPALAPLILTCALLLVSPTTARAQLTPDRLYVGVDRAIPMTVAL